MATHPLGTLSALPLELHEHIWTLVLASTRITYDKLDVRPPLALLHCSTGLREDVLSTIVRTRDVMVQNAPALLRLLRNCVSPRAPNARFTASSWPQVPKRLRLSLFRGYGRELSEGQVESHIDVDKKGLHTKVDYPGLDCELDAWTIAMRQLPMESLKTLTLDFIVDPGAGYQRYTAPPNMYSFTNRVALRMLMASKGKCEGLLMGPPLNVQNMIKNCGHPARAWTAKDER
ncbi:hypothetical protein BDW02DRAFT_564440 [Decorospora gaudefroyi]|uniref:F-box domain-containing protein n=1 Tax=Decorospora gaudefroyi TaxID=184978 RepID=A0A6A5KPF2_9PLEO|nr:hypothetical protein BDW02DRAFT_564440 [Decorospora gaudefroyi]